MKETQPSSHELFLYWDGDKKHQIITSIIAIIIISNPQCYLNLEDTAGLKLLATSTVRGPDSADGSRYFGLLLNRVGDHHKDYNEYLIRIMNTIRIACQGKIRVTF